MSIDIDDAARAEHGPEGHDHEPPRARFRHAGLGLIRCDRPRGEEGSPPEDGKAEAVEGRGSLVAALLKAIRARPRERRREVRHPAADPEAWVGWWSGEDFGAIQGRLIDLSRGGALIELARRPPRRTPVWIYKDVDATLASVRGEVVDYMPTPGGAYRVRFRFTAPCPTPLCEAVLCRRGPGPLTAQEDCKVPMAEDR